MCNSNISSNSNVSSKSDSDKNGNGSGLGEHKPGRIKRAALSLQNQNYYIFCFLIRPILYASER